MFINYLYAMPGALNRLFNSNISAMIHSCYAHLIYENTEDLEGLSDLKAMASHLSSLTAEHILLPTKQHNFAPVLKILANANI